MAASGRRGPAQHDAALRAAVEEIAPLFEKAKSVDYVGERDLARVTIVGCTKCGAKVGGAKFCPDCGTPTSVKKSCASCGATARARRNSAPSAASRCADGTR